MPATECQGSSVLFASIGRSFLSLRRDHVHSIDAHHESPRGSSSHDLELEVFQEHVSDLLHDLYSPPSTCGAGDGGDELLSVSWIRRLLDSFLICQAEFRVILYTCSKALEGAPLDRLLCDFLNRVVKALDVCNAVRDGVDQLRLWRRHLEIALAVLEGGARALGEGQLRRARKALATLTVLMLNEKETGRWLNHRSLSFGRSSKDASLRIGGGGSATSPVASAGHLRSLSCSVSRSWSAARQLQAMGTNLAPPRANEAAATCGLADAVYTMSSVLHFVMWALVAAIPCQDRGLQAHFSAGRSFVWAASMTSIQKRILEESKRKDRKNTVGLLKEINQIEKLSGQLAELLDPSELPLTEEKEMELKQGIEELKEVHNALKEGCIESLERQLKAVFLRLMRSRSQVLLYLNKSHNPE